MNDSNIDVPRILRIAVLSDIHAHNFDKIEQRKPSYFRTVSSTDIRLDPYAGLVNLIETDPEIKVDLLLCCGDLGDKAVPSAISYVWDKLHQLKEKLNAKKLYVTPGNHDVDSRYGYNDFDAKGLLQSLTPPFPLNNEKLCDKFWARNYAIDEGQDYRIALLNTSAYHGYAPDVNVPEFEHGRVADRTIDALVKELELLEKTNPKPARILLCHHHPHNVGEIGNEDTSVMKGGQKLLDRLGSGTSGNWIIIHGHRHYPQIAYAASTSSESPVVFSVGSFSAMLAPELASIVTNQFYMIELEIEGLESLGLEIAGTFRSWDWNNGVGWTRAATRVTGLPGSGGFGNRAGSTQMANRIEEAYTKGGFESYANWSEIVAFVPELKFTLPADLQNIVSLLENHRGFNVLDQNGIPHQLSKK